MKISKIEQLNIILTREEGETLYSMLREAETFDKDYTSNERQFAENLADIIGTEIYQ